MTMEDWSNNIIQYFTFTGHPILKDTGKVSHGEAELFAETEFEKYRVIQDRLFSSDFDKYRDGELPFMDMPKNE